MDNHLKLGAGFSLLGALIYYWTNNSAAEIAMDILIVSLSVSGIFLFLRWGKTLIEELGKRGDTAIQNKINPTPIYENQYQNDTRETTNQPRNDRENAARGSTEASTVKSGQTIRVSFQKREQIKNEVIRFLRDSTKEGKVWLNYSHNLNNNLTQLAKICEVEKIVIIRVIESYPDEFRIFEGYAYSATAYDEKLRATQYAKRETEVHFDATEPVNNETPKEPGETKEEVFA